MFIQLKTVIFETNWIDFNADNTITFKALHDNDIRIIPLSEVISVSKIHP